jgi:hypothetical protein
VGAGGGLLLFVPPVGPLGTKVWASLRGGALLSPNRNCVIAATTRYHISIAVNSSKSRMSIA